MLQLSCPLHNKQGHRHKKYFVSFILIQGKIHISSFFPPFCFWRIFLGIFGSVFKDVFIWTEPVFEIFWLRYTLLSSGWNVFLKRGNKWRGSSEYIKNFSMHSQSRWKNDTVLLSKRRMDVSKDLSCVGIQRWLEWRQELLESWFIHIYTVVWTTGLWTLFSSRQWLLVLTLGIV